MLYVHSLSLRLREKRERGEKRKNVDIKRPMELASNTKRKCKHKSVLFYTKKKSDVAHTKERTRASLQIKATMNEDRDGPTQLICKFKRRRRRTFVASSTTLHQKQQQVEP